MQEKKKETLIIKNIFKGKDADTQKLGFNICYEKYIKFKENKV